MRRVLRTVVVLLVWPVVYLADKARGVNPPVSFRAGLEWARGIHTPAIPTATEPARVNRRDANRELEDQLQAVIDAHTATYHPGRTCRENERGECGDRFGGTPRHPEES